MKVEKTSLFFSFILAFVTLDLTLKRKLRNQVYFSRFILAFASVDLTLKNKFQAPSEAFNPPKIS